MTLFAEPGSAITYFIAFEEPLFDAAIVIGEENLYVPALITTAAPPETFVSAEVISEADVQ